jgi:hypothetical protein
MSADSIVAKFKARRETMTVDAADRTVEARARATKRLDNLAAGRKKIQDEVLPLLRKVERDLDLGEFEVSFDATSVRPEVVFKIRNGPTVVIVANGRDVFISRRANSNGFRPDTPFSTDGLISTIDDLTDANIEALVSLALDESFALGS